MTYNLLTLPNTLSFSNPVATGNKTYTYLADGRKIKVVQTLTKPTATTWTTEYIGNRMYENNVLKRTLVEGGYISRALCTIIL